MTDEFAGVLRRVTFDDGATHMEGAHDFTWGCWKQRVANGKPYQPEIFKSPHIHSALGGECRVDSAVLQGPADIPLRLVALEEQGLYAVYNFFEETAAYRLKTPHGTAADKLGFGRILYRAGKGKLRAIERVTFSRRWSG